MSIHLKRGEIVHGTDSEVRDVFGSLLKCANYGMAIQGALIPAGVDISHLQVSETVSWVLIVEKEVGMQGHGLPCRFIQIL